MENKVLNWEGMSNSSIKKELEGIVHRQISIREKMVQLSEILDFNDFSNGEYELDIFNINVNRVKHYDSELINL